MEQVIFVIAGALIGGIAVWIALKSSRAFAEKTLAEKEKTLTEKEETIVALTGMVASEKTRNENLTEKLEKDRLKTEELQKQFQTEFENIANKLLEDKSKKFTEQNKTQLDDLLKPLKEKISEFQGKVEQVNKESIDRNAALIQQIRGLKDLNEQMSKEAINLTKALKGDSKARGNWGEIILESILEKSGLVKDREYKVQESMTAADGRRLQPDVVVHLPENKHIVIDSKVALVAYEKFVSAEDETLQEKAAKEHVAAVRNHIRDLSQKNYQQLYDTGSLDFVLLFIPVEPAFAIACQWDSSLFEDAFEKNIVIVSPSTLLATLRTIASIWRHEYQNQNVLEIARLGGVIYDKIHDSLDELIKVGDSLDSTKKTYESALKRLTSGSGNVVKTAEKMKALGAKAGKQIPRKLIDRGDG